MLCKIKQWTELMIQMTNASSLRVFPISRLREMFALPAAITQHAIFIQDARRPWQIMQRCVGSSVSLSGVNEVWLHIFICSLCFNLIYSKRRRSGAVLHHINICLIACAAPLVYFCKTAALLDTDDTERWFPLLYFLHNSTGQ